MTLSDGPVRPMAPPTRTRSGARRLDPQRDRAITAAVVDVLTRDGYGGLTMDAVALAAGVGKATIYRRWSSKSDLLAAVLDGVGDELLAVPDTGDLREDLVAVLTAAAGVLRGPSGLAARCLSGLAGEPVLGALRRQGPLAQWEQAMATVLDRAVQRGEVSAAARSSPAAASGPAIIQLRWLVTAEPLDDDVVAEIVDGVMIPLLRRC